MAEHKQQRKPYDSVGAIISYESGELDDWEIIELFQHLVDTGIIWNLQGSYQRMASAMLKNGDIHT